MSQTTMAGVGSLIKHLPSGTVFLFQFLNPVLTNNGHCHTINRYLSAVLIGVCGFSCCFSTFTDCYVGSDGKTYYGIATRTGIWPSSMKSSTGSSVNLSAYKLRFADFVHAFFTTNVFAVVVLLDEDTMQCFYPSFESTQKDLLMVLPQVVGAISGLVFTLFPNKRRGIGCPSSETSNKKETPLRASLGSGDAQKTTRSFLPNQSTSFHTGSSESAPSTPFHMEFHAESSQSVPFHIEPNGLRELMDWWFRWIE